MASKKYLYQIFFFTVHSVWRSIKDLYKIHLTFFLFFLLFWQLKYLQYVFNKQKLACEARWPVIESESSVCCLERTHGWRQRICSITRGINDCHDENLWLCDSSRIWLRSQSVCCVLDVWSSVCGMLQLPRGLINIQMDFCAWKAPVPWL